MSTRHTTIDSPLGPLTLVATDDHLTGLYFRHHHRRPDPSTLGSPVTLERDVLLAQAGGQLEEYFAAKRTDFDLAVALIGSPRQQHIWELLSHIDYGQTCSYGDLATQMGDGATAYEIGQTVGRNPVSIIVPCHRVVGKDGALTGYAGGLTRKRFLLGLEEPVPAMAGRLF